MLEEKYVDHKRVYVFKPAANIRSALGFLGRFFSLRNLTTAFRSVTRGFFEYFPFFAACFALQLIFWAGMTYSDIRLESAIDEAYASSDCHLIVDGLTSDERTAIENGHLWIASQLSPEKRMYESYDFDEYTISPGGKRYEMHILLDIDSRERGEDFLSYYQIRGAASQVRYTERITLIEQARTRDTVGRWAFFIVCLLFAALALMILFNIRTNHYKFRYGIYMSFGAGFEKLFETASWELFMISILTFIPAAAAGVGIAALIYLPRGASYAWRTADLWLALLFDLCAVFAATALPILVLSKKSPVSLLTAEDNSNLVSSPRRSAFIFGKRFPSVYELYGMFRFRRYFAGLLLGAISFSTVFLCGVFLSSRQQDMDAAPVPQYTLTVSERNGIDEFDLELAADVQGVDYLMWDVSQKTSAARGHIVLSHAQAGSQNYNTTRAQDGESVATNSAKYMALDEALIGMATTHGAWEVTGDLSSVLADEYTVAVSEYIYNGRELNFKVGDRIRAAVFVNQLSPLDLTITDARLNLEQEIKKGEFAYIDLTVGAVIDTGLAEDAFTVAVSPELYQKLTGSAPVVQSADIYLCNGIDDAAAEDAFFELRRLFAGYAGFSLRDSNADATERLNGRANIRGVTLLCLTAVLALSPLVWFFSQSMFFTKRRGEFEMLSAFGAGDADLRSLHLFSGGVTAVCSFFVSVVLGALFGWLSFWVLDNFLPKYGFTEAVRHGFDLSLPACIICLIVSAACGFASAYAPYRRFVKERARTKRAQLGE